MLTSPCNHQFSCRIPEETLSDLFNYNLVLTAMLNPFILSLLSYGIHYRTQLFLVKKLKHLRMTLLITIIVYSL